MNPPSAAALGDPAAPAADAGASSSQPQGRHEGGGGRKRRAPDSRFMFSWKLSADNVVDGREDSPAGRKTSCASSSSSQRRAASAPVAAPSSTSSTSTSTAAATAVANLQAAHERLKSMHRQDDRKRATKRERPKEDKSRKRRVEADEDQDEEEVIELVVEEDLVGGRRWSREEGCDLDLGELVIDDDVRRLAGQVPLELRAAAAGQQEEEERYLSLNDMFKLHPLGVGLGEKLQKLKDEGVVLEPERLMHRLTPELNKYEQLINERREKEKRRQELLAQVVQLHDQGKRLRHERLRDVKEIAVSSSEDEGKQDNSDSTASAEQALVPIREARFNSRDVHLLKWTEMQLMLEEYQQNAWAFSPLHPSATNEDNVRLVLYGDHSWEREASALALNVHTALALGSLITGNEERAKHFFLLARNEVGTMFDSSDYNVAEALVGLRYFAYALGDVEQACYFMTMAMSICRQLGAYSSDVYTRCLADLYFLPSTSPLERKRWLSEYCKYASGPSAFDATRIYSVVYTNSDNDPSSGRRMSESNTYHASLVKKSNYNNFSSIESVLQLFVRALIALDRSGAGMRGKELGEAGQVMSDIQHTDSEMAARVLGTKASYPMRMAGGLGKPGGAKPSPAASHTTDAILTFLNTQFSVLETSILKDTLPASFTLTVLLCCASMRAEAYWCLGDTAKALECAKKYVSISGQIESRIRHISITHLPYCNKILHVLLYLDELDLLETQLKAFRPLFELYPSWRETREYYEQKLAERKGQQQTEQRRSNMKDDEVQRLKREIEQLHRALANTDHQRTPEPLDQLDPLRSPLLPPAVVSPSIDARSSSGERGGPATRTTPPHWIDPRLPSAAIEPLQLSVQYFPPTSAPTFPSPTNSTSAMPLAAASAAAAAANDVASFLASGPRTQPVTYQPPRHGAAIPPQQLQLPPLPRYAHQIASSSSSSSSSFSSSSGSPEASLPGASLSYEQPSHEDLEGPLYPAEPESYPNLPSSSARRQW